MKNYKNKNVLVTGGSGFVGANLVRALIKQNAKVNLFLRPEAQTWRLKDILKQVKVHPVNITNPAAVRRVVKKIRPQVIFHLAAYGAYPTQTGIMPAIQTNILGTVNLLEAFRNINCTFINTGTSSEYGYKQKPMKETDVLEPTFPYAATKASATLVGQVFAKQFNRPFVTLRPFSIYGPWEEPSRFIPTIINNCLTGQPIKLTPGKEVRDWVYVEDMVRAYLLAGIRPDLSGEIFNIGSGKQTTILATAKTIIKLIDRPVELKIGAYPPRIWDTNFWVADRSKAKKMLNWEPQHSLVQGLKKTIDWFKTNQDFPESKRLTV